MTTALTQISSGTSSSGTTVISPSRGRNIADTTSPDLIQVGDYGVHVGVTPYIREQAIHFFSSGLRPQSKVWIFFDGINVTEYVVPAAVANTDLVTNSLDVLDQIEAEAASLAERQDLSLADRALTVEADGTLAGVFHLPPGRFLVGDRDFVIADVSSFNSIDSATTISRQPFHAYNYDYREVATRAAELADGTNDGVATDVGANGRQNVLGNSNNTASASNNVIKVFSQTAYNGNSITFTNVSGNLRDYSANGITNWQGNAKSVQVLAGSYTLYDGLGQTGNNSTISANTTDISWLNAKSFAPSDPARVYSLALAEIHEPLSQTFSIGNVPNGVGLLMMQIGLWFKTKSSKHGITVELRECVNGVPSNRIVPHASKWLPARRVNVSEDATEETLFVFDNPVLLKVGGEYAIVVIPDGLNPSYSVFTAVQGQVDISTGTVKRSDWGNGLLFLPTNNPAAWTPITGEDMKFRVYVAYNVITPSTPGYLNLVNESLEFLDLSTSNGTFVGGERVFQITANIAGNITANSQSLTVTGVGTTFQTVTPVGSFITIPNSNTSPTKYDLVKVANVASNTSLTLARKPRYSVTTGKTMVPVYGKVEQFNANTGDLVLTDSAAANSTFLFAAGNTVYGVRSGATGTINVVSNETINYFQPLIHRVQYNTTSLKLKTRVSNTTYGLQSETAAKFNDTNRLNGYVGIIASRSNEIANNAGAKSFRANIEFNTRFLRLSPLVDRQNMGMIAYSYNISNDSTNEHTPQDGAALCKHITSTVTLAANQEAEDIRVYLTAFKPSTSDIKVYAKLLNQTDPEPLNTKYWTELKQVTANNVVSDVSDVDNYVELEYTFEDKPQIYGVANGFATVANTSTTVTGVSTVWESGTGNSVLTTNDAIMIVNSDDPSVYDIQKVTAVTNNTSITVASNVAFNNGGARIYKLKRPYCGFKNDNNDGIVRYFGVDGGIYDGYQIFAIKIVLLSDSTDVIPRVADMRAIAMSV